MQKLPVVQVLREAIDIVWIAKRHLFVGLIPTALLYLLTINLIRFLIPQTGEVSFTTAIWAYVAIVFLIPAYTFCAVTIHRLVLLGPGSVPWYGQLSVSRRELKFAGYVIGAWAVFYLLFAANSSLITSILNESDLVELFASGGAINILIFAFFVTPAAYVLARISMGFPAIATDHYSGWRGAWRLSRGNSLRLFFVTMVVPWVYERITDYLPGSDQIVVWLFYTSTAFAVFVVEIAIVSIAFKYLSMINQQNITKKTDLSL